MARSQETFNKKEKENQKAKKRKEKAAKKEERKSTSGKKSLEDMMAYVDENGNIVLTKLEEDNLKKMALATQGAYIHADNTSFSLENLYKLKVAPLQGREIESKKKKHCVLVKCITMKAITQALKQTPYIWLPAYKNDFIVFYCSNRKNFSVKPAR